MIKMEYKYYFFPLESNNGKSEKLKTLEGTILYFNQKDKVNINSKMAFIYYDGNYFYDAYSNQVLDMKLNNGNISINNTNYSTKAVEVSDDKFFFEFCVLEKYKDFLKNILSEFIIHEQNVYKPKRVLNSENYVVNSRTNIVNNCTADNNRSNIVNNCTADNYKNKTGYYLFPLLMHNPTGLYNPNSLLTKDMYGNYEPRYKFKFASTCCGSDTYHYLSNDTKYSNFLLVYRDGNTFREVFSNLNLNISCILIGHMKDGLELMHSYRIKDTYYQANSIRFKKIDYDEFAKVYNLFLPNKDKMSKWVIDYVETLKLYHSTNEKIIKDYSAREYFSLKVKTKVDSFSENLKSFFSAFNIFNEILVYKDGSYYYEVFTGYPLDARWQSHYNIDAQYTFYNCKFQIGENYKINESINKHVRKLSENEFKNKIKYISQAEDYYIKELKEYIKYINSSFEKFYKNYVYSNREKKGYYYKAPKATNDPEINDFIVRHRKKD